MWFLFPLVPVIATATFKVFGSKAITAELIGTEISSGLGYKPGEGPLSAPHPMLVTAESPTYLGQTVYTLAKHFPKVMGKYEGKRFMFTASEELEALELLKAVTTAIDKSRTAAQLIAQTNDAIIEKMGQGDLEGARQLEELVVTYRSAGGSANYFAGVGLLPLAGYLDRFPERRVQGVQ